MPDLYLVKADCGNGVFALHADGPESQVVFDKMPVGKSLACEVKQSRSVQHLKLYWSICHRIANALDRDDIDAEKVSDFFKKATGYTEEMETKTQGNILRLKSISFAKMDQIAFNDFFEKCIRFALAEWGIPHSVFADLLQPQTEKRGG